MSGNPGYTDPGGPYDKDDPAVILCKTEENSRNPDNSVNSCACGCVIILAMAVILLLLFAFFWRCFA